MSWVTLNYSSSFAIGNNSIGVLNEFSSGPYFIYTLFVSVIQGLMHLVNDSVASPFEWDVLATRVAHYTSLHRLNDNPQVSKLILL